MAFGSTFAVGVVDDTPSQNIAAFILKSQTSTFFGIHSCRLVCFVTSLAT
jgi:hypothetical protein